MDFKTEYQNELNKLSPTEEQCERIRSGVMQKLSEDMPVKRKKPLYLKIAAVSGAAVCAAAVAIVIFAGIKPKVNWSGNSVISPSANGTMGNTAKGEDTNNAPANNGTDSDTISGFDGTKSNGSDQGGTSAEQSAAQNASPNSGVSTPGGTAPSPYLTFPEDKSTCEAVLNGEIYEYRKADGISGEAFSKDKAAAAGSNLDTELFVQFDENIMTVFFADGTLFGVYEKA